MGHGAPAVSGWAGQDGADKQPVDGAENMSGVGLAAPQALAGSCSHACPLPLPRFWCAPALSHPSRGRTGVPSNPRGASGHLPSPPPPARGGPTVPRGTRPLAGSAAGGMLVGHTTPWTLPRGRWQRPRVAEGTGLAGWEEAETLGGFYSLQEFIQLDSDFSSTEWVLNSYKLLRVQLQPI